MFRQETKSLLRTVVQFESTMSGEDESLVGIDTKIPGGKFDSSVQRAQQGS